MGAQNVLAPCHAIHLFTDLDLPMPGDVLEDPDRDPQDRQREEADQKSDEDTDAKRLLVASSLKVPLSKLGRVFRGDLHGANYSTTRT